MAVMTLDVDGSSHRLDVEPEMPLLYALRGELGMNNPRFGCGLAQCGSCTVLMDGQPIRACVVPVAAVTGKVQTLNGLGTVGEPHPVQQAFIDEQALFCGYCMNGWNPLRRGAARARPRSRRRDHPAGVHKVEVPLRLAFGDPAGGQAGFRDDFGTGRYCAFGRRCGAYGTRRCGAFRRGSRAPFGSGRRGAR